MYNSCCESCKYGTSTGNPECVTCKGSNYDPVKTTGELDWVKSHLRDIVRNQDNGSIDQERDHKRADEILLAYINDGEVRDLFNSIDKWYA